MPGDLLLPCRVDQTTTLGAHRGLVPGVLYEPDAVRVEVVGRHAGTVAEPDVWGVVDHDLTFRGQQTRVRRGRPSGSRLEHVGVANE